MSLNLRNLAKLPQKFQTRPISGCERTNPFAKTTYMPIDLVRNFIQNLLKKLKVRSADRAVVADCLIEADKINNFPHGIFSLPKYVNAINNCEVEINVEPKIIYENIAMATVCGANALGPIVGTFCMNLAIEKAKDQGFSCVTANYSNYFGMAGYYSLLAMRECLIGISMTNTPPMVIPLNGMCPVIGTNPLAFYADAGPHEMVALDIATSKMSREKIEWLAAMCEKLPPNAALNMEGCPTQIPKQALIANKLLTNSDHHSYGLGLSIEILAGILSGANFGPRFDKRDPYECEPLNVGHLFIVIDPSKFNMYFDDFLMCFLENIRDSLPACPEKPIRVPGDCADWHAREAETNGLKYNWVQKDILRCYAQEYNVHDLHDYIHK